MIAPRTSVQATLATSRAMKNKNTPTMAARNNMVPGLPRKGLASSMESVEEEITR